MNIERDGPMHQDDEAILRYTKEIIVKFIELGRVSPGSFDEHFRSIFWSIKNTVVGARLPELGDKLFDEDQSEDS